MQTGRWLVLMLGLLAAAGCREYIHEPWVPDASYLQQERARDARLAVMLDSRLRFQQDR